MVASRSVAFATLLLLLLKQQANADACPEDDDETDLCDRTSAAYVAWQEAQDAAHSSHSHSDDDETEETELEDTNGALSRHAPSQTLVFSLLLAPICGKHSVWLAMLASIAGMAKPAAADGPSSTTCGHLKSIFLEEECCGVPDLEIGFQSVPNPPRGTNMRLAARNPCDGKKGLTQPTLDNAACFVEGVRQAGAQAGADVTADFTGGIETDVAPISEPYYKTALCPVNVHWHLGAEHRSAGEYDEEGRGPSNEHDQNAPPHARRLQYAHTRYGYACRHYDATDPMYTTPYNWQHCVGMSVGETYEVHWPHSSLGACGTPNQYQTPFYDGVFCGATAELIGSLQPQDIASNVGVQGQVFTIVNDEHYYYPDLVRGMIVDSSADPQMGIDVAVYTGSTTGTSRNNSVCSSYTPITWQVDRKCHKISASSFDKMCADMKQMRDDMSSDLHAHGARELVWQNLTANNQAVFLPNR